MNPNADSAGCSLLSSPPTAVPAKEEEPQVEQPEEESGAAALPLPENEANLEVVNGDDNINEVDGVSPRLETEDSGEKEVSGETARGGAPSSSQSSPQSPSLLRVGHQQTLSREQLAHNVLPEERVQTTRASLSRPGGLLPLFYLEQSVATLEAARSTGANGRRAIAGDGELPPQDKAGTGNKGAGSGIRRLSFFNVFSRRKGKRFSLSDRTLHHARGLRRTQAGGDGCELPSAKPLADDTPDAPHGDTGRIIQELSAPLPLRARIALVRQTSALLRTRLVPDVAALWITVQDLLDPQQPLEARAAAFEFISSAAQGQSETLGPLRLIFFNIIKNHAMTSSVKGRRGAVEDDYNLRLTALKHLTKDGREILSFSKDIVPLLTDLIARVFEENFFHSREPDGTKTSASPPELLAALSLAANVVKFNFAQLEENEIVRLVETAHNVCARTSRIDDMQACLALFDVIVRFGFVSDSCIRRFLEALCRTVNYDPVAVGSWQIMKNLLRSHCAHAAIRTLCGIVGEASSGGSPDHPTQTGPNSKQQPESKVLELIFTQERADSAGESLRVKRVSSKMIRGAIFYLGMATWGTQQVEGLTHSFVSVLAALHSVLPLRMKVVNYEILLNVNRLARKYAERLSVIEWWMVQDIVHELASYLISDFEDKSAFESMCLGPGMDNACHEQSAPISSQDVPIPAGAYRGEVTEQGSKFKKLYDPASGISDFSNNTLDFWTLFSRTIYQLHQVATSSPPVSTFSAARFMKTLHHLRRHLPPDLSNVLLDHFKSEHSVHPSNPDWLSLLVSVVQCFYLDTTQPADIRFRVLKMVRDVYDEVKDFFQDELAGEVISPIAELLPLQERNEEIAKYALELTAAVAADQCGSDANDSVFPVLLEALARCSQCMCSEGNAPDRPPGASHKADPATPDSGRAARPPALPSKNLSLKPPAGGGTLGAHASYSGVPGPFGVTAACSPASSGPVAVTVSSPAANAKTETFRGVCLSLTALGHIFKLFQSTLRQRVNSRYASDVLQKILAVAPPGSAHPQTRNRALEILFSLRAGISHRVYLSCSAADPSSPMQHAASVPEVVSASTIASSSVATGSAGASTAGAKCFWTSPFVVSFVYTRESAMFQPGMHRDEPAQEERDNSRPQGTFEPGPASSMPPIAGEHRTLTVLPMGLLVTTLLQILRTETDWNTFNVVHSQLPAMLGHKHLFCGATDEIRALRTFFCEWVGGARIAETVTNMPQEVRRADVYAAAYAVLTALIGYRRLFNKSELDELVLAFQLGLSKWVQTAKPCIHALSVCCHELPMSVTKLLPSTLVALAQVMSAATMSMHILEFLSGLARLPHLYVNFVENDYRRVFGIAFQYIQSSHMQHAQQQQGKQTSQSQQQQHQRQQQPLAQPPDPYPQPQQQGDAGAAALTVSTAAAHALSQYVLTLAYHAITVWFLSLRLPERKRFVPFIVRGLLLACEAGADLKKIDEQTETCLDMLSRYTYAACEPRLEKSLMGRLLLQNTPRQRAGPSGLTSSVSADAAGLGPGVSSKTWVYGSAVVTICVAANSGWAETTVRRASGTARFLLNLENRLRGEEADFANLPAILMMNWSKRNKELLAKPGDGGVPPDEVPGPIDAVPPLDPAAATQSVAEKVFGGHAVGPGQPYSRKGESYVDPGFIFLQMTSAADMLTREPPILLPDDDVTARALNVLDRTPVVDFHKVGVVYVGPGQTDEVSILANTHGSPSYARFLYSLGHLVLLKGCTEIYTGGLDTGMDLDGRFAFYWSDDVTQLVFHTTTMMPTDLQRDPQCTAKKRHIGNDFVIIVYNDRGSGAGAEYRHDTIPGQFNFINVIVTPLSRGTATGVDASFAVQVQRRHDMPEIGPASNPKILSASAVGPFVRQVALHANIFAQVFLQSGGGSSTAAGKVEYVSNWKERLRQIKRVKSRNIAAAGNHGQAASGGGGGIALPSAATGIGAAPALTPPASSAASVVSPLLSSLAGSGPDPASPSSTSSSAKVAPAGPVSSGSPSAAASHIATARFSAAVGVDGQSSLLPDAAGGASRPATHRVLEWERVADFSKWGG